eukprot:sb/3461820/
MDTLKKHLAMIASVPSMQATYLDILAFLTKPALYSDPAIQQRYFKDFVLVLQPVAGCEREMATVATQLILQCKKMILEDSQAFEDSITLLMSYVQVSTTKSSGLPAFLLDGLALLLEPPPGMEEVSKTNIENILRTILENMPAAPQKAGQLSWDTGRLISYSRKLKLAMRVLQFGLEGNFHQIIYDSVSLVGKILKSNNLKLTADLFPYLSLVLQMGTLEREAAALVATSIRELQPVETPTDLVSTVILIGVHSDNMEWLVETVSCLLLKLPDSLSEVLENLHTYRDYFQETSKPVSWPEHLVDLQTQMDCFTVLPPQSYTNLSIFDIVYIDAYAKLIRFYANKKCWTAFKDCCDEYKSLLLKGDAKFEAAHLSVFADEVSPTSPGDLMEVVELFSTESQWENALSVLEVMKKRADYSSNTDKHTLLKLAEISEQSGVLYRNLAEKPHIPFHYFLVSLVGKGAPENLRGRHFVVRGKPLESPRDFSARASEYFKGWELLGSSKFPPEAGDTVNKGLNIILVKKESSQFLHERCWVRNSSCKNELLRMGYETTIIAIDTSLQITPFYEVKQWNTREIPPVEMALLQIQRKTTELKKEGAKFDSDNGCVSHFQMLLNGVIDAAVNGGTEKLQSTFLCPEFEASEPHLKPFCDALRDEIEIQRDLLTWCLEIHDRVCPDELRMLHEKMVRQHHNKPAPTVSGSGEGMKRLHNGPSPLATTLTRRDTKIGRKLKRVTSYFFESGQQRVDLPECNIPMRDNPISSDREDYGELEYIFTQLSTSLKLDFAVNDTPREEEGEGFGGEVPALPPKKTQRQKRPQSLLDMPLTEEPEEDVIPTPFTSLPISASAPSTSSSPLTETLGVAPEDFSLKTLASTFRISEQRERRSTYGKKDFGTKESRKLSLNELRGLADSKDTSSEG